MKWYYYCLIIIGLLMVNIVVTSFKSSEVKVAGYPSEQSRILWAYDKNHPDFSPPRERSKTKRPIVEDDLYHMKFEDGYFLQIQDDNTLLLKDGDKIVHVFNRSYVPNGNLFYVIDRDNY